MADETVNGGSADPSGNTQAFRAFVHNTPAEPARSRTPLLIGAAAVVVLVVAVVLYALM
jgi:hypothetical protein